MRSELTGVMFDRSDEEEYDNNAWNSAGEDEEADMFEANSEDEAFLDDGEEEEEVEAIREVEPIQSYRGDETHVLDRSDAVPDDLRREMEMWVRTRAKKRKVKYCQSLYGCSSRLRQPEGSFGALKSSLRPYLAPGCVEFDVNWCFMSIVVKLAKEFDMDASVLEGFMHDKKGTRVRPWWIWFDIDNFELTFKFSCRNAYRPKW